MNQNLFAQGRRSIEINQRRWVFSDSLSLLFLPNGQVQVESDKVGLTASCFISQCIYDSTDLKPLFYSAGTALYDSTNIQISSNIVSSFPAQDRGNTYLFPTFNDSVYFYYSREWNLSSNDENTYKVKLINGLNSFDIIEQTLNSGVRHLYQAPIIKHGNGRDFWMISHLEGNIYEREIVSDGQFIFSDTQQIGVSISLDTANVSTDFCFSPSGTKLAAGLSLYGVYVYDFDRCTGQLSNEKLIFGASDLSVQNPLRYQGVAFSPNEKYLYVLANGMSHQRIYQVNLYPQQDEDTVQLMYHTERHCQGNFCWTEEVNFPHIISPGFWQPQLAINNKIYFSSMWGATMVINPVADSMSGFIGVVNFPDSAYPACMFNQYEIWCNAVPYGESGSLVNYKMGPLLNSLCDTLSSTTGIANLEKDIQFKVFPNPTNDKFNISWPVQGGYTWALKSLAGSVLNSGTQQAGNATISTAHLPEGMYFLEVHSAKESKVEKVVIVR